MYVPSCVVSVYVHEWLVVDVATAPHALPAAFVACVRPSVPAGPIAAIPAIDSLQSVRVNLARADDARRGGDGATTPLPVAAFGVTGIPPRLPMADDRLAPKPRVGYRAVAVASVSA